MENMWLICISEKIRTNAVKAIIEENITEMKKQLNMKIKKDYQVPVNLINVTNI